MPKGYHNVYRSDEKNSSLTNPNSLKHRPEHLHGSHSESLKCQTSHSRLTERHGAAFPDSQMLKREQTRDQNETRMRPNQFGSAELTSHRDFRMSRTSCTDSATTADLPGTRICRLALATACRRCGGQSSTEQ